MTYEIYDTETGNLWSSFHSEEKALAEVRRAISQTGECSVASWAVVRSDYQGAALCGADLISRAYGAVLA
jgi:hypothetical protein